MDKKAFTLIELLGVITVLGVIALIIVPVTDKVIKDAKEKVYEEQKLSIIASLKEWQIDNITEFYDNNTKILKLGELKEQGYIEYDIRNPKTDKCVSNDLQLEVVKDGSKFTHSIVGDELIDGPEDDCNV